MALATDETFAGLFELNPEGETTVDVQYLVDDRYPVVVVDNFYKRPDAVRDFALGLAFEGERGLYPGRDAAIPADTRTFFDRIEALYNRVYPSPMRLVPPYLPGEFVFSILTTRFSDFDRRQRVPHTDSGWLAGLVYLNLPDQCSGGTAIYRHRETGLVWAPISNPAAHNPAYARRISEIIDGGAGWREISAVMDRNGLRSVAELPQLIYRHNDEQLEPIAGTTKHWELLRGIDMRFNRFVMYPGCVFHAGLAKPDAFGERIHERRLTQNIFIVWPRI